MKLINPLALLLLLPVVLLATACASKLSEDEARQQILEARVAQPLMHQAKLGNVEPLHDYFKYGSIRDYNDRKRYKDYSKKHNILFSTGIKKSIELELLVITNLTVGEKYKRSDGKTGVIDSAKLALTQAGAQCALLKNKSYKIEVGRVRDIKITGIQKISETAARVEYTPFFEKTCFYEAFKSGFPNRLFSSKTRNAYFELYSDGWRLQ